ncbi:MAG: sulfite exporter TauE/SafE family protein [Phycisphaeraceae bacterium]
MELSVLLWVMLAQALGFFVQGMVGFGAGLIVTPLLVLAGMELPHAIAAMLGGVVVATGMGCWRRRGDVAWRVVGMMSVYRLIGLPVGVWLLSALMTQEPSLIKQAVGLVLAVAVLAMWMFRVRPVPRLGHGWMVAAGLGSGVLGGLVGMSGPLVVMWVMAHDWAAVRSRATLWALFLVFSPPLVVMLGWTFGWDVLWSFGLGLALFPAAMVAEYAGDHLGRGFSSVGLRRAAYGLLLVIALVAIVEPWV